MSRLLAFWYLFVLLQYLMPLYYYRLQMGDVSPQPVKGSGRRKSQFDARMISVRGDL